MLHYLSTATRHSFVPRPTNFCLRVRVRVYVFTVDAFMFSLVSHTTKQLRLLELTLRAVLLTLFVPKYRTFERLQTVSQSVNCMLQH